MVMKILSLALFLGVISTSASMASFCEGPDFSRKQQSSSYRHTPGFQTPTYRTNANSYYEQQRLSKLYQSLRTGKPQSTAQPVYASRSWQETYPTQKYNQAVMTKKKQMKHKETQPGTAEIIIEAEATFDRKFANAEPNMPNSNNNNLMAEVVAEFNNVTASETQNDQAQVIHLEHDDYQEVNT